MDLTESSRTLPRTRPSGDPLVDAVTRVRDLGANPRLRQTRLIVALAYGFTPAELVRYDRHPRSIVSQNHHYNTGHPLYKALVGRNRPTVEARSHHDSSCALQAGPSWPYGRHRANCIPQCSAGSGRGGRINRDVASAAISQQISSSTRPDTRRPPHAQSTRTSPRG
jgi:hypothetical protein